MVILFPVAIAIATAMTCYIHLPLATRINTGHLLYSCNNNNYIHTCVVTGYNHPHPHVVDYMISCMHIHVCQKVPYMQMSQHFVGLSHYNNISVHLYVLSKQVDS